ncbi:MAG: PSD1 and planctomycete cytochrome C domain-containing protein [Bryobacteraceae bacterium]
MGASSILRLLVFGAVAWGADADAVAILRANCAQCHTKGLAMSGLDLTSREAAMKGGARGAALVAGKAAESKLIEAVERKGKLAMPPAKALSEGDVAVLRRWIDDGAKWPEATQGAVSTWWAFQKVVRPPVSKSIDEYILERLRADGLAPGSRAGTAVLARRAYLDLWGLPPTMEQVREFTEDQSADAWPKLIDKLLTSPHYGEKWGRHWLDLVRYSDTAGSEIDAYIPDAWRYRDWVVKSFNEDKPYDRFIREQIAGDELYPENAVAHSGTGLYCVGPNRDSLPDQADINREETLTDFVDTTSAVFLGLTAGCARCHDHKFDPISQEDYYRVRAIFAPAVKTKVALDRLTSLGFDIAENVREWRLRELGEQIRAAQARCKEKIRKPNADDEIRACMSPEETAALQSVEKALVRMYADYRAKPFACGIADSWNVAPRTFLPSRGARAEQEVQPGFFAVLGGGEVPPPAEKRESTGPIPLMPTTGRRAALAKWISDPANPLTARVMVNRVWQYHFGRGLVATPSDFGTRSGKPTHPELLDSLAAQFVNKGWSIKHLHRTIMNSAVYQRAAVPSKAAAERDPANLLLSHFSRRRLNADEVHDAVLLATGALNLKLGGRPVVPPLTVEETASFSQRPDSAWVLTADKSEHTRRSLYMIQKRTFRMPMMEVFDTPDSMLTCARRESSTTAPQSLTLLNGALTMERSRDLAAKLGAQYPVDDAALIGGAWRRILTREPTSAEVSRAVAFLATQSKNTGGRTEALVELIRALLNVNEFLYVD